MLRPDLAKAPAEADMFLLNLSWAPHSSKAAARAERRVADLPKSRQISTHVKTPIISPISLDG